MWVYLKVTPDKYELPILQANSIKEMCELAGVQPRAIYRAIYKHKAEGSHTSYRKVWVEDED